LEGHIVCVEMLGFLSSTQPTRSAIALSAIKVIALSTAKMIAVLNLNQQDDSDRTFFDKVQSLIFFDAYYKYEY
jgi:hypothetical protein